MSNISGNLSLLVFVIDNDNQLEVLKAIVKIDEDFSLVAEEIAEDIMKSTETIEDSIKKVLKLKEHEEVESNFLLNNSNFCENVEYEITTLGDKVVLSLAYTT